jgi:hypothetical protein
MNSLLPLLIPLLVAIIAQAKTIYDIWKDRKTNKANNTLLVQAVRGLENEIVKQGIKWDEVDKKLDGLIKDNDFKNEFQNTLRMKATQLLNLSRVEPVHRSVLNYFEQLVEDFGLRFYYSSCRKSTEIGKYDLREYLETDYEIKRAYLRKFVDEHINDLKYINNTKVTFLDLLMKSKASAKAELLIETLIRNGLSQQDVIREFEHFMIDYFNIYLDTITLWNTLQINSHDATK